METRNFISTIASRVGLARSSRSHCPREEEILAYLGAELDDPAHARIESHLAECEDCRELLVAVARYHAPAEPISEQAAAQQVRLIKSYVERESRKRPVVTAGSFGQPKPGFSLSYQQLAAAAMVVVALGVGLVFWPRDNDSRAREANEILQLAVAENRAVPGWISGIAKYAPHESTRGAQGTGNLNLDRALNKVRDAKDSNARPSERLALAEILISTGNSAQIAEAKAILEQLPQAKSLEPEKLAAIYNDAGVAQLYLRDIEAALNSFDRALSYSPSMHQALFNRALALQSASRYRESREAWERFLSLPVDQKWKDEAQYRMNQVPASN